MYAKTNNLPYCQNCHIRTSALFGNLDINLLDSVRDMRASQLLLESGEHLYHQGDQATSAYTLYDGWVALYRHSTDGHRQILRFALPGEFLGFKVGENIVYDHSAKALSPVELCCFPLLKLYDNMFQNPQLLFAIQAMNDAVIERCHSSITSIASKSAEAKVAFLFVALHSRQKAINNDSNESIYFPLTQEDIADALGLTSIHVNRVIQGLRNKGLIACKNKKLQILHFSQLVEIAQMEPYELEKFTTPVTSYTPQNTFCRNHS